MGVSGVWWARASASTFAELSEDEQQKTFALKRERDRRLRATAYALRRRVLAQFYGLSPHALRFTSHCANCGRTDHGSPQLVAPGARQLFFSVSHSGDVAAIAVSDETAVGIDIEEEIDERAWLEINASVLCEGDDLSTLSRAELWTAKEAALKETRFGLAIPMNALCVVRTGADSGIVTVNDARAERRLHVQWFALEQYRVAVASRARIPQLQLHCYSFGGEPMLSPSEART